MARNVPVDRYMERLFGKPDFTKTFFNSDDGRWWTPISNKYKLWRVDAYMPAADCEMV